MTTGCSLRPRGAEFQPLPQTVHCFAQAVIFARVQQRLQLVLAGLHLQHEQLYIFHPHLRSLFFPPPSRCQAQRNHAETIGAQRQQRVDAVPDRIDPGPGQVGEGQREDEIKQGNQNRRGGGMDTQMGTDDRQRQHQQIDRKSASRTLAAIQGNKASAKIERGKNNRAIVPASSSARTAILTAKMTPLRFIALPPLKQTVFVIIIPQFRSIYNPHRSNENTACLSVNCSNLLPLCVLLIGRGDIPLIFLKAREK